VGFEEKETQPRDVYARLRNSVHGTYEYSLRNGLCLANHLWSLPSDELRRLRRLAERLGYEVAADGLIPRARRKPLRKPKPPHPRQLALFGGE
jgi:hypothetical protein